MKYHIQEMNRGERLYAASKARNDVERILEEMGYNSLSVETQENKPNDNILRKLTRSFVNSFSWLKMVSKLFNEDIVVVQFPFNNTILFSSKIIKSIKKKKVLSVALIHDLDSIRAVNSNLAHQLRTKYEDNTTLKLFDFIIVHNETMRRILIEKGFEPNKLIILGMFDYLTSLSFRGARVEKSLPIVIAGNLSPQKAKYIYNLHEVADTGFNLYGVKYENRGENYPNIYYKGAYRPEELPNTIEGSYGLVWDGEDIKSCKGQWGNYLKYNNPHKLSLYIASGLPVIVWDQSAMALFVKKHKIGIVVSSICEIRQKTSIISDKEYDTMCANAKEVSQKLRNGNYLKVAIKKIENIVSIANYQVS